MERRKFLTHSTALPFIAPSNVGNTNLHFKINKPVNWKSISNEFIRHKNTLNLNTGSAGLISKSTQRFMRQCLDEMCATSPYKALENWDETIKNIKLKLAKSIDVLPEEIALVNNTTEAINFVLQGYPFKPGDEVIAAKHDYPYVINTIKNLEKHKGIKANIIQTDLQNCTKEELITHYKKALISKPKLLILTYITHREGMVLPVEELIEIAHQNGTEVLLDAAHAYAHIPHNLKLLNCDYYATSLHKWLSAPYGNGLLFIKSDKIEKINPIISSYENEKESIKKFEHSGTRAFQNMAAIQPAMDFLLDLGVENKHKRLKYLSNYWIKQIQEIPNVKLMTNTTHFNYGGITSFQVEKQSSRKIAKELFQDYNIIAKATGNKDWSAIRISTNVFVLEKHLDKLVQAVKTIVKK